MLPGMSHVALVERTAWLLSMITSLLDVLIAEARYRGVSTKGAIPMDLVFSSTTQLAACVGYLAYPFQSQEGNRQTGNCNATYLIQRWQRKGTNRAIIP